MLTHTLPCNAVGIAHARGDGLEAHLPSPLNVSPSNIATHQYASMPWYVLKYAKAASCENNTAL
jgi:hypothetical protein